MMGSARVRDFGQANFFFFWNGMVHKLYKKKYKNFPRARAHTQLQNRTDTNQYLTVRSP